METNNYTNNPLILYIKKCFNIINQIEEVNERRPLYHISWIFKDYDYLPEVREKLIKAGLSFEDINIELNKIILNDVFLRNCCANNIYNLMAIIDVIFFKDSKPLYIAKGYLDNLCQDFHNLIYNTGPYFKKVFYHIYNLENSVNIDESFIDGFKLEYIPILIIPELIGEKSFLSSIHPMEGSYYFLTKEDNLPVDDINSHILLCWKEANKFIQIMQYLKDEPICIDYATIYFSPYWLNSVRREGIFLHGRPSQPLTDKQF